LTLTAMMCAHLLKPHGEEKETRFNRWTERQWERLSAVYDRGLKWVLDHQPLTLAVTIATLGLHLPPRGDHPQRVLSHQDTGLIIGVSEAAPTRPSPG